MREKELLSLTWNCITVEENSIVIDCVSIRDVCKNGKPASFQINSKMIKSRACPVMILKIYISSFKKSQQEGLFFRRFKKNKTPYKIAIGKKLLKDAIVKAAKTMNYETEDIKWTTHSLRRSGATMLAENGISPEELLLWGRWNKMDVALRYIEKSRQMRNNLANNFISQSDEEKSTSPIKPIQTERINEELSGKKRVLSPTNLEN